MLKLCAFFLLLILSNLKITAQNKYLNRSQITFLFHNPFSSSTFYNELIDSLSKSKIYLPMFSSDMQKNAKLPKQLYQPLFNYETNYEITITAENETTYPIFNQFDYNAVEKPKIDFSFLDILENPNKLRDYAVEILQYNFNANAKTEYNFVRLSKRALYNAKDNDVILSSNSILGDNIIKDNIDKIFENVFIIGIEPISSKTNIYKLLEIEFAVMIFKINYDLLFDDDTFWSTCFNKDKLNLCLSNKDLIQIFVTDLKTISIEIDPSTNSIFPWNFEQRVFINLIQKMLQILIK
jgi:hypothetical protein